MTKQGCDRIQGAACDWREGVAGLPIASSLDEIVSRLKNSPSRSLVLTAETAAGKSTAVPLALMEAFPGKILVTEPRRLAAVAVASRHVQLLGEEPGGRAGYRLRYDTCVSSATRIEVMTDAILTRIIQSDPALDGVSVVVLDEFHERSLHTDLSLVFLKEIMSLRDDLYLVVMSATMDADKVAEFLGDGEPVPRFHVEGRRFPVEMQYRSPGKLSPWEICARVVMEELEAASPNGNDGAMLVFLPGIGEIRRCQQLLEEAGAGRLAQILLLHSSISLEEQRLVLGSPIPPNNAPAAGNCSSKEQRLVLGGGSSSSGNSAVARQQTHGRRVILSSAIAETSLTVPDVTLVIDCGLSRLGRFDPRTGMSRLVTETESDFSTEQRAGRSGRLGPGRCIRLWSPEERRLASPPPEITRTDLVPVVLECARWGACKLESLDWLDSPSSGGWNAAATLLREMGCLDADGGITDLGRNVLELGVHPRVGCVALSGGAGAVDLAARYGAADTAEEQRLARDLRRRLSSLGSRGRGGAKDVGLGNGLAVLAGFPDRLAKSCGDGLYQFPSGRTARLFSARQRGGNSFAPWIVGVDVDAGDSSGRIYRWEELDSAAVETWLEKHAVTTVELDVDDGNGKVVKHQVRRYGKLELERRRLVPDTSDVAAALCAQIRRRGFDSLPLSPRIQLLLLRTRFYRQSVQTQQTNTFESATLLESLEEWLVPFLAGKTKLTEEIVYSGLHWFCDGPTVDREIPLSLTLPNGKNRKLTYEVIAGRVVPVLEVIVQELFGCFETPRVAGVPVLLRLLSPARRPLQVTSDLAGFWQNTWPEVCKEMKGRYPKHNWDYRCQEK